MKKCALGLLGLIAAIGTAWADDSKMIKVFDASITMTDKMQVFELSEEIYLSKVSVDLYYATPGANPKPTEPRAKFWCQGAAQRVMAVSSDGKDEYPLQIDITSPDQVWKPVSNLSSTPRVRKLKIAFSDLNTEKNRSACNWMTVKSGIEVFFPGKPPVLKDIQVYSNNPTLMSVGYRNAPAQKLYDAMSGVDAIAFAGQLQNKSLTTSTEKRLEVANFRLNCTKSVNSGLTGGGTSHTCTLSVEGSEKIEWENTSREYSKLTAAFGIKSDGIDVRTLAPGVELKHGSVAGKAPALTLIVTRIKLSGEAPTEPKSRTYENNAATEIYNSIRLKPADDATSSKTLKAGGLLVNCSTTENCVVTLTGARLAVNPNANDPRKRWFIELNQGDGEYVSHNLSGLLETPATVEGTLADGFKFFCQADAVAKVKNCVVSLEIK